MGKRGPAPEPTPLKLLKGVDKRRINTSEPKPAEGPVKIPAWLSKEARTVWRSLAADLTRVGVLTPWDAEAFARYCDAITHFRVAAKALQEEGLVVPSPTQADPNRLVRNPWMLVWAASAAEATRLGARFGLTPSDRSQIKMAHGSQKSDKSHLLS